MKKNSYKILSATLGAIIFGIIGLFKFAGIGARNCDTDGKFCECFCCHMFNSRGYEACGDFGLMAGIVFGGILGLILSGVNWRKFSKPAKR